MNQSNNDNTQNLSYKSSGVDIDAGNELISKIKKSVASTFSSNVLSNIGGFGAMFNFDKDKYKEPVLVSSTDGVGTKLKVAFMCNNHKTIGQDLVAMVVNDIIVQGALPLFFLDYFATGKLDVNTAQDVITGIAEGCKIAGCSLIGGETAEMPSIYQEGEYDVAGFGVGVVDRSKLITGMDVKEGDTLLGIASSGLHSNGYSLARKVIFEKKGLSVTDKIFDNVTVGDVLLTPTKIYVKPILSLIDKINVKAMVHVTGGGFYENIPRILPPGLGVNIDKNSFPITQIFQYLSQHGNINQEEMFRTFNMGIGIIVVLDNTDVTPAMEALASLNEKSYVLGHVTTGENKVVLK